MPGPIRYAELHDAAWLREKYVDNAMSSTAIADELGCAATVVLDALRKHGIPPRRRGQREKPWHERFWRYLTPGDPDACWEWQGSRDARGYGRLNSGGGTYIKAHRASYEIHHGPFDPELDVCHHCDNPPCCNPAHLFLGTAKDNGQDMARKGRHKNRAGEESHNARLTDEDVRAIRERVASGEGHLPIAQAYGVARGYVSLLAVGRVRAEAGGPFTRRHRARDAGAGAIRDRAPRSCGEPDGADACAAGTAGAGAPLGEATLGDAHASSTASRARADSR